MENQGNPQKNMYLRQQRKLLLFGAMIVVALIAALILTYMRISGAFRGIPKVEAHARNTYRDTLHVVTDIDYEPFSYLDDNGEYAGLDVEMINEIANRLEMNLDFELLDWNMVNQRFLNGEADAILNMETDSVAASDSMIATIPTAEKQYVVYGREKVGSVAELYGKKVASLHYMPDLGLDREITYLDSYAEIFEALKNGEYDFAICPIQVGNVFLQKLNIRDVTSSYAVGHVYGAIALHPEATELQGRLNAIIADLQREGYLDELDAKWISSRYQSVTFAGMVKAHPEIALIFLLGLIMVLFLFALLMLQRRNSLVQKAYTERLQENLKTIDQKNAELTEATARAEAGSQAKTTFLFNMSHDIRTPMNAIIGYTNLAKREGTSESEMRDFLDKIDSSSQHLLALINDVLEMSRIESGKMELESVETDLVKTIDEVRDMFATQMEGKGITYSVTAEEMTDRWVLCDKNRLDRVLLNLISNAYKFTPEGGSVAVSLRQTAGTEDTGDYELRIKDSGIGMSQEFAAKVFEAFERERTSTVSGIQGAGLGMAITKSIVDIMGGSIRVETAQGKGTEFIVQLRFPLTAAAEVEDASDADASETRMLDFSKMRLLLAEDNEINREIATMILEEAGFTLDTAVNGQEAVDQVTASEPGYYDAVLMDVQMPVMNGYDATRAIRALENPALANIPIVAMTANAFTEDKQAAKEAGMNAHVAKPIDVAALMETLHEILR